MHFSKSVDFLYQPMDCPACKERGNTKSEDGQIRRRNSKKGPRIATSIESNGSGITRSVTRVIHREGFRTPTTGCTINLVEEHWTKVLQANEKACAYNRPCNCKNIQRCHSFKRRNVHRNKDVDTHISSMFQRFCVWISSKWKLNETRLETDIRKSSSRVSAKDRIDTTDSGTSDYESYYNLKPRVGLQRESSNSPCISDTEDPNYVYIRSKSSQADSVNDSSSSEVNSNVYGQYLSVPSPQPEDDQQTRRSICSNNSGQDKSRSRSPDRQPLTVTTSCPAKSHSTSRHIAGQHPNVTFLGTWPLARKRQEHLQEEIDSVFDEELTMSRFQSSGTHEPVDEFLIPYKDIDFGEQKKSGRQCSIYSGRWHGNVNVHYFGSLKKEESSEFWSKVTQLHRIRHENIALFLGACVDPQHYAIVLSIQDGVSLYELIHVQQEKMNLQSKIQLLRQVAYGMGYLHAKGIVIKSLSTRNVFMCPKARISVMDYGFPEKHLERCHYACLPRGQLTYISPEILSTMKVVPPQLITSETFTLKSDVFSYGTVIYEILAYRYPYSNIDPETTIWRVCKGQRQHLDRINGSRVMKMLIEQCWSHNASKRPSFAEISRGLHRNVSLRKSHSVSHPDNLNHTGNMANYSYI